MKIFRKNSKLNYFDLCLVSLIQVNQRLNITLFPLKEQEKAGRGRVGSSTL